MFGRGTKYDALIKEGWLRKEGAKVKNWKIRLFRLYPKRLEYYKKAPFTGTLVRITAQTICLIFYLILYKLFVHQVLRGSIEFHSMSTVEAVEGAIKGNDNLFMITRPDRRLFITTKNEEERKEWIEAIASALRELKAETTESTGFIFRTPKQLQIISYPQQGTVKIWRLNTPHR